MSLTADSGLITADVTCATADGYNGCNITTPGRGGGWLETPDTSKARRDNERKRRKEWQQLERDIEEAYAEAAGILRAEVKPVVREALAQRNTETVRRIVERLAKSADPAAARLTERIEQRLDSIEQLARQIQDAEFARMADEDEAIQVLLMVS
jgi:gas vesicle protein